MAKVEITGRNNLSVEQAVSLVSTKFNDAFGDSKQIAIDLLSETIKILKEYDINYCLISGTLLGKIRHNDFIPWDDDIDLLVDDSFNNKLLDILKKYGNKLTFLGVLDGKSGGKICFTNRGTEMATDYHGCKKQILNQNGKYNWPFVDLFVYNINDNIINFFNKEWDKDKFLPFTKTNFLGLNVNIPCDSDYFLKINFDEDYMTRLISNWYIHKNEESIPPEQVASMTMRGYIYIKNIMRENNE